MTALKNDRVTSVTIYDIDKNCKKYGPTKLLQSLNAAGFQDVSCDDDISDLVLAETMSSGNYENDAEKSTESGGEKEEEGDAPSVKDTGSSIAPGESSSTSSTNIGEQIPAMPIHKNHPFRRLLKAVFLLGLVCWAMYELFKNGYVSKECLRRVGYDPVGGSSGYSIYQRVSTNPVERLPLHTVDDSSSSSKSTTKDESNGIPREKVVMT